MTGMNPAGWAYPAQVYAGVVSGNLALDTPNARVPSSPGLNLNNFRVIKLATPARQAIGRGFSLWSAAVISGAVPPPSEVTLELLQYPDFDTVLSTLDNTHSRQFTAQKSDVGSGAFTIQMDDADFVLVVRGGDYFVRFRRFGEGCLIMHCETYAQVSLSEDDDDSQQGIVWSGPGHLHILDDGVIYPARGLERLPREVDRPFTGPQLRMMTLDGLLQSS